MRRRKLRAAVVLRIFCGLLVLCVLFSVYLNMRVPAPNTLARPQVIDARIPISVFRIENDEFTESVRRRIRWAFRSYWTRCNSSDYLTSECLNSSSLHITAIEALEALFLAGLWEEFDSVEAFVEESFRCESSDWISVSEMGTKVIGGLIGAYGLTGKNVFLEKACSCAELLISAFQGPIPHPIIDGSRKQARNYEFMSGTTLGESSGFLVEFAALARLTGDTKFIKLVHKYLECVQSCLNDYPQLPALWSTSKCRALGGGTGVTSVTASFIANVLRLHLMTPSPHTQKVIDRMAAMLGNGILATLSRDTLDKTVFNSNVCQLVWLLHRLNDTRFAQASRELTTKCLPRQDDQGFDFGTLQSISAKTPTPFDNQTICGASECSMIRQQAPSVLENLQPSAAISQWLKFLLLANSSIPWDWAMINEAGHFIPH